MISYYELELEIKLKRNVYFSKSHELLSKFFNKVMLLDEYLKKLHKDSGFKLYSFSGLYPAENDKIYKTNKLYKIRMRSLDAKFTCAMQFALSQITDRDINVISIKLIKKQQQFINEIVTITPAVFTINPKEGYWQIGNDIDLLEKRMTTNLEKKYNALFNTEIENSDIFLHCLNVTNMKTIYIPYKEGLLLSNKFRIQVKEDDISQKLATIALGAGLGEKNSIGMGFCYAH